jgi:argininosuccinate lyase
MKEVACADLVNVGKALDYLLIKGVDRDIAVRVVEHLGGYCRTRNKYLSDLALNEWQLYSPAFEDDIYEYVSMEDSVGEFCSFGGSSREQVELAISRTKDAIAQDKGRLDQLSSKYSVKSV